MKSLIFSTSGLRTSNVSWYRRPGLPPAEASVTYSRTSGRTSYASVSLLRAGVKRRAYLRDRARDGSESVQDVDEELPLLQQGLQFAHPLQPLRRLPHKSRVIKIVDRVCLHAAWFPQPINNSMVDHHDLWVPTTVRHGSRTWKGWMRMSIAGATG
jgi:hypothetical protein